MDVIWTTEPCGASVLSLDLGGWHLCAVFGTRSRGYPPPHAFVALQVFVTCPENFAHSQIVALRADDPDVARLREHAGAECVRILRAFALPGAEDDEVRVRQIEGSPRAGENHSPEMRRNLSEGRLAGASGDWLQDAATDDRMDPFKPAERMRLGDVVMRRLDELDRGSGRRAHAILPSSRAAFQACLEDHPWLAEKTVVGGGRRIVHALKATAVRRWSPTALARLQSSIPGIEIAWTSAAIACSDAFWGVAGPECPPTRVPVEFLSVLPPEWMPKDHDAYASASRMSAIWWKRWSIAGSGAADGIRSLLADTGGRWQDAERRTIEAAGVRDLDAALSGIGDMLDHVRERIVEPCLEWAGIDGRGLHGDDLAPRTARILVSPDAGIVEMARRSARWHAVQRTLPVPVAMPARTWPALTEDHVEGDMALTFLRSDVELDEEGGAMRHCVGSYARRCAERGVHIASIRRAGERLSTVEVRTERGAVVVHQHRGHANAHPPEGTTGILSRWFGRVMDKELAVDPEAMRLDRTVSGTVFEIPPSGTPADWRGILQRRLCSASWEDLRSETISVASGLEGRPFDPDPDEDVGIFGRFGF